MATDVYLAVGHGEKPDGRHDPGATAGKWSEQTAGDLIVSTAATTARDTFGLSAIDEGYTDDPAFRGTVGAANAAGARVLVTVHHDSPSAPPGAFAYYHQNTRTGDKLAWSIVDELRHVTGTRNAWRGPGRGYAQEPVTARDLYVLRESRMPAVLVECGPIGAYSADQLRSIGRALAVGIADHLGAAMANDERPPVPDDTPEYARESVRKAIAAGVFSKHSDPHREVTDARLAVFLDRAGVLDR